MLQSSNLEIYNDSKSYFQRRAGESHSLVGSYFVGEQLIALGQVMRQVASLAAGGRDTRIIDGFKELRGRRCASI